MHDRQMSHSPSLFVSGFLAAFPSAPILSASEEFLYLAGASAAAFCVETDSGDFLWTAETTAMHQAEPVLTEMEGENSVVYFMEVCVQCDCRILNVLYSY